MMAKRNLEFKNQLCDLFKIKKGQGYGRRYSKPQKLACRRAIEAGMSLREITHLTGVTSSTLNKWYSQEGLEKQGQPEKGGIQILEVNQVSSPIQESRSPAMVLSTAGFRIEIFDWGMRI